MAIPIGVAVKVGTAAYQAKKAVDNKKLKEENKRLKEDIVLGTDSERKNPYKDIKKNTLKNEKKTQSSFKDAVKKQEKTLQKDVDRKGLANQKENDTVLER